MFRISFLKGPANAAFFSAYFSIADWDPPQDAELPQFTIMGWETNERKIKLATGTYQVIRTFQAFRPKV
jgi:hypothetical protein